MANIDLPRSRQVKHLTLLREPRTLPLRDFNKLALDDQLRVLQSVSGKQKYMLLVESSAAAQLIEHVPVQELYLLTRELGLEDVPELVTLATTEQLSLLIDLDCWDEEHLDGPAALRWLAVLLDAGEERLAAVFQQLELELLVLMLQAWLTVVSGPEAINDDDARAESIARDGGYVVEYRDAEAAKIVGRALDILRHHDASLYVQLLEATRQELPAQLEEDVYRWRGGRLAEYGFCEPLEARAVYAWLDPERFRTEDWRKKVAPPGPPGVDPPGYLLSEVRVRRLLEEVLERGVSAEEAWELTFLVNRVMSANRVDPGDFGQVRAILEHVYGLLNLALEKLCAEDAEQAAGLFGTVYLEALFRFGFSLTLQLQRRARSLHRCAAGPLFAAPFRGLLDALLRQPPEFYLGVEDLDRHGGRPFAALTDVERVANWLGRIELQQRLFEGGLPVPLPDVSAFDLEDCVPERSEDLTLTGLFLTGLANRLLEGEFCYRPVPIDRLAELHRLVSRDGCLDQGLRDEVCSWAETLVPGAGAFAEWCLGSWDEEFCTLDAAEVDVRYLEGPIWRLR